VEKWCTKIGTDDDYDDILKKLEPSAKQLDEII
jgi:hypothetical protein